jgi:hypothetical protein
MGILCAVIFFSFFFFSSLDFAFFFWTVEMAEMERVEGWTCSALYFCFRPYVTVLKRQAVYFKMRSEGHQDLCLTTSHTLHTHHTHTLVRVRNQHSNSTRVKDYAATTDPTHIATKERFLRHQHVVNTSCVATNPAHIATKKHSLRHQRIECRVRDM